MMRPAGLPPLPPVIRGVAFEIIEACNLYCEFCVRNASHGLKGALAVDEFEKRLERATADFRLRLIALTGGEPFLHKEIVAMLTRAQDFAHAVSVTTNGTVLRHEQLDAIAHLPRVHFIASLDGPPSVHDMVRGRNGAFAKLRRFVAEVRRREIPVLINMTVNERNYRHVYRTIEIAASWGASDISIALVKPEGRGRQIENGGPVLSETGRQYLLAKKRLDSADFEVRFIEPLGHIFDPALRSRGGGCGAGSEMVHVQVDGRVLLCTSCKESIGNISDEEFSLKTAIQSDSRANAVNTRTGLGGACHTCEFLAACGGCRCRAGVTEFGFLGPDPLCPKTVRPDPSVRDRLRLAASRHLPRRSLDETSEWGPIETIARWFDHGVIPSVTLGARLCAVGAIAIDELVLLAACGLEVDVLREDAAAHALPARPEDIRSLPIRILGCSIQGLMARSSAVYDYVYLSDTREWQDPIAVLVAVRDQLKSTGQLLLCTTEARPGSKTAMLLEMLNFVGFGSIRIVNFGANDRLQLLASKGDGYGQDLPGVEFGRAITTSRL